VGFDNERGKGDHCHMDGKELPYKFTSVGQLSEKRWNIVRAAQGKGEMSVRELARVVDREVKRVHDDIVILAELGLLERTYSGGVSCPFKSMHIDMYLQAA
jgi:predicted transcriptional regulator